MRTLIWFSFSLLVAAAASGQTTSTAPPAAQPPAAPRRAPAPAPPLRAGIAITVTDGHGLPIHDVHVDIAGPSDRNGETDNAGQVNFVGMQAGTYRARFSGDGVTPFEREVIVRAGQPTVIDVTLNAAPPPPPAPAPPPQPVAAAAPVGPAGQPGATSVLDILDKQFVGKQPRRETLLSCSGNTRTTMIQLNDPLPDRLYEGAEAEYYVVAGEGTARLGGRDIPITGSSAVSVPRGTLHSFSRKGNRPLILLAVLSGEPCEQPK